MRTDGTRRDDGIGTVDFDIEQYVSYADGDGTVIADRRNPSAWVRSTDVRSCRR